MLRVIFLLIATSAIAAVGQERGKAYDGAWWSTATIERRLGWLAGYINCATSKEGKKELGL